MGVPITFFDHYDDEFYELSIFKPTKTDTEGDIYEIDEVKHFPNFEILGTSKGFAPPKCHAKGTPYNAVIDGETLFARVFIRNPLPLILEEIVEAIKIFMKQGDSKVFFELSRPTEE